MTTGISIYQGVSLSCESWVFAAPCEAGAAATPDVDEAVAVFGSLRVEDVVSGGSPAVSLGLVTRNTLTLQPHVKIMSVAHYSKLMLSDAP